MPRSLILLVLVSLKLSVHLPVLRRYGYHRDELYFIDCGEHLSLGYVDHAPFVPWLVALTGFLFDHDLAGMRLISVAAGAATVAVSALIVRELGGPPRAELLAGLCIIAAPAYLRMGQTLCIPAFEVLWCTLAAWLVARRLRTGNSRLWLAIGLVLGCGLLTKHTTVVWAFGLAIGVLASDLRRDLLTPWPWAGAALALLLFSPNLLWQAEHGWPTLEFILRARRGMLTKTPRELFLLGQLLYMNPLTLPVWAIGLSAALCGSARAHRVFGWTFVAALVAFFVTRAKPYYLAPAYPPLYAIGAIVVERALARRGSARALFAVVCGHGVALALAVALALPVLPLERTDRILGRVLGAIVPPKGLTHDLHDQYGWPEQSATLAKVRDALPPEERRALAILTENYGQASAANFFGPALGLPRAFSGHMTHYFWVNERIDAPLVIAFGLHRSQLDALFTQVRVVATIDHPLAMERDLPVYLVSRPRRPLSQVWPELKRFHHDKE